MTTTTHASNAVALPRALAQIEQRRASCKTPLTNLRLLIFCVHGRIWCVEQVLFRVLGRFFLQ